jgi:hypothetical protein
VFSQLFVIAIVLTGAVPGAVKTDMAFCYNSGFAYVWELKKASAQLQESPFQGYDRARKRHYLSPKRDYWQRHFVFL